MQSAFARSITTLKRQRGMATLAIALVLLLALTLLTFNVAKVGGLEQRISANDMRTLSAHETAQTAIEQAIAYLNANLPRIDPVVSPGVANSGSWTWAFCSTETTLPCGDGQTNHYGNAWLKLTLPNQISLPDSPYTTTVYLLTESEGGQVDVRDQPRMIILASVTPNSDPLAGSAVVQQLVKYFSSVNMPSSPLAARGQVTLTGNFRVYGNPNPPSSFYPPLQTGRPLSVWSGNAVTLGGNAATCVPGSNCSGQNKLSYKQGNNTINGGDIAHNHNGFPADPFQYVFGVPTSQADTVKNKSTVLADCSSLTDASSGQIWVTGDCHITSPVGSATAPAIIVVEGNVRMYGNPHVYGLIYKKGSGTIELTGNSVLWGGLVSDHAVDLGAGNYTFRYLDLSKILTNNTGGFAKVPGGWLDTYQKPVS
jgi:Tfp pilus assembly protein PilX